MLPKLFRAVTSAIVALAMLKTRLLVISRFPFPQVVQAIPKVKGPVPSPLKAPVLRATFVLQTSE